MSQVSAVQERERRSTAGSRMTSLVGQAAKDDDEFWNHSTWAEDEDGSFHESDEESEARRDTFDSDFDDSEDEEGDSNGNDDGKIASEEADVLMEERREKRAKSKRKMVDVVSAGRELMQKRRNASQRKKALKGDGINAGLVLNVPGSSDASTVAPGTGIAARQKAVARKKAASAKASPGTATITSTPERKSTRIRTSTLKASNDESVKKGTAKRSLRISTINNSIQSSSDQQKQQQQGVSTATTPTSARGAKRDRRKFTQEELILEAVQVTEPENERWLLSRKRIQSEESTRAEFNKKLMMSESNRDKKVVCKYNSKRGCYNTLTFPSMDHVPEIFTRPRVDENKRQLLSKQRLKESTCVITGKKAKYRDPRTGKSYHDLAAFKELRRRLTAGEKLESCPILSDEGASSLLSSSTTKKECIIEKEQRDILMKTSSQEIDKTTCTTKDKLLLTLPKQENLSGKKQDLLIHSKTIPSRNPPKQETGETLCKNKDSLFLSSSGEENKINEKLKNEPIPSMNISTQESIKTSRKSEDNILPVIQDKPSTRCKASKEIKLKSMNQENKVVPSMNASSQGMNELICKSEDKILPVKKDESSKIRKPFGETKSKNANQNKKIIPDQNQSSQVKHETTCKNKNNTIPVKKDEPSKSKVCEQLGQMKSKKVSQNINVCNTLTNVKPSILNEEIISKEINTPSVSSQPYSEVEKPIVVKSMGIDHKQSPTKITANVNEVLNSSNGKKSNLPITTSSVKDSLNERGSIEVGSISKVMPSPPAGRKLFSDLTSPSFGDVIPLTVTDHNKSKQKCSRSTSSKKDSHGTKHDATNTKMNSFAPSLLTATTPLSNNSPLITHSLNQNLQQFPPVIQPQFQNNALPQYYPTEQRIDPNHPIYQNTMNQIVQITGQRSFYQPSPINMASLYSMSLNQQNTLPGAIPLQLHNPSMYYNNSIQDILNGGQIPYNGYPSSSQAIYPHLNGINNSQTQNQSKKDERQDQNP